jgi:hypothetical protein
MMARHQLPALLAVLFAVILMISAFSYHFPVSTSTDRITSTMIQAPTRASMNFTDYEVEYALITSEALAPSFQPLIDWKIQKGLKAKIYTIDGSAGIYQSYDMGDNAQRIHDFLHDLDVNSANLQWVTIGGDSQIIPSRHMWAGARSAYNNSDWEDYYYSDYYYAGLNSTWNKDGDNKFGEPGEEDVSPNVYVGRLPAKNAQEAKIMVDRTVRYESNITDGDWLSRGFFAASLMDAPNVFDDTLTPGVDEGYNEYKDNAFEGVKEALPYVSASLTKKELYDYPQITGGNYEVSSDTLNMAGFKAEMNKGYSIVNYLGQALYGGNELVHYENESGTSQSYGSGFKPLYTYSDAKAITNGNKASFIVMATCDSGNFTETDDTNMENLLKAGNGGAIGLIASSGRSYRGEHEDGNSFGNWWFNKFLIKNFYGGNTVQGELLYDLKEEYYTKVYSTDPERCPMPECVIGNVYGYNLLGDPETDIYTNRASTFTVQVGNVYSGSNAVTITVKDQFGDPVGNAKISLLGLGVLARGTTGADGKATIVFTTPSIGVMDITVTKHNFKAYSSSVNVVERPLDLEVDNEDFLVEVLNGIPGQQIPMNITVWNNADIRLNSIKATLEDEYDGDTTTLQEFTFDLTALGNHTLDYDFISDLSGDHNLTLTVDSDGKVSESNENNNIAKQTIHIDHPPTFHPLPEILMMEDEHKINALNLLDYADDADNKNHELSFSLVSNEELSCFVTVTAGGDVSIAPEPEWNGETTAWISVTDGLLSATQSLDVIVESEPDPPVIGDIGDQTAYIDEMYTLMVSATDADKGDVITYSSDSDLAEIDANTGRISFIPYKDNAGSYSVTITATDSGGLTGTATFTLVVKENDQPYIKQQSFNAYIDEEFKKTIKVENAIPGHTYTFSDNTDLFDIDPNTGKIKFTPTEDEKGTHSVRITAVDDQDGTEIDNIITLDVKEKKGGNTVAIVILLIIVIIAMGVVVFYFFIRPNLRKGEEEEEEEKDERIKPGRPLPRLKRGKIEDKDRTGKDRPRRPGRKGDHEEPKGSSGRRFGRSGNEEEEGSKGLFGGLLKLDKDDESDKDKERKKRGGPPTVRPRIVKKPVGADDKKGRRKKDD